MRNTLLQPQIDLSRWPEEEVLFATNDGSGDQLGAKLHQREESAALVVLVHGLTGAKIASQSDIVQKRFWKPVIPF